MSNEGALDLPYDELIILSKEELIKKVNFYRNLNASNYCELRNTQLMADRFEFELRRLQMCILEGKDQKELAEIVKEIWGTGNNE